MTPRSPAGGWRLSPEALLVRVGVFVSGLVSLLVAAPAEVVAATAVLLALVALAVVPAVLPGGSWPTIVALCAIGGWLAATTFAGEPVTAWRLLSLAAALYLLHSCAALACGLPLDGSVAPEVVTRWLGRALVVIVTASVLSLVLLAATGRLATGSHQAATLIGLAVAAGLAALLSAAGRVANR